MRRYRSPRPISISAAGRYSSGTVRTIAGERSGWTHGLVGARALASRAGQAPPWAHCSVWSSAPPAATAGPRRRAARAALGRHRSGGAPALRAGSVAPRARRRAVTRRDPAAAGPAPARPLAPLDTGTYLQGISSEEIISTIDTRRAPMMNASAGARPLEQRAGAHDALPHTTRRRPGQLVREAPLLKAATAPHERNSQTPVLHFDRCVSVEVR